MDLAERAGDWTLSRLAELPRDGNRYEVIDGNLIVSPPPPPWHQAVGSVLLVQLIAQCPPEWLAVYESYVDYGGDGRVPDLLVVRRSALRRRGQLAYLPGEVGLAVEIVSPSSRRTDRLAKPAEYAEVRIPLMWRVQLEPELVVHPFRLEQGSWIAEPPVDSIGTAVVPWGRADIDLTELRED
jgi:Uma2 family endonuclease